MTEALITGTGVASTEVVVITTGITMVQVVTEVDITEEEIIEDIKDE